jgi:hypothetical protein
MNIPKITCPKKIIEETLKCISNTSEDDSSKNTKRIIKDTFEWFFMNNISDDITKDNLFKSINNTFIHSLKKYQQKFIVNLDPPNETVHTRKGFLDPPNETVHTRKGFLDPPNETVHTRKGFLDPPKETVHMFIDKLLIEIDINFNLLTDLNEHQHKNKLCVILYAYLIICVYN